MEYSLTLKTDSAIEPIGVSEWMEFAHKDQEEGEEKLIPTLIKGMRKICERWMRRACIDQTWVMTFDSWPADESAVELPVSPLSSVVGLNTYDDDGDATEISSTLYWLDTAAEHGLLVLKSGTVVVPSRLVRGIEIEFVAGYGDETTDVPDDLRLGIMQAITDSYESGEMEVSPKASKLLLPYQVMDL